MILLLISGCMNVQNPVVNSILYGCVVNANQYDNHMSWGFYELEFNANHDQCVIIPVRSAGFHLNSLLYIEQVPCTNCLTLSNLQSMGDGIIEFDIKLAHPFGTQLIYSGFDVKGIIMFEASFKSNSWFLWSTYPELNPMMISWAKRGDWELLNPDGYSYFWSPPFNPDSSWQITEYIQGKFAKGTPTGIANGYKDFFTDEDRHLFRPGHSVSNTYRVQTQPGPMTVGYAVDACWASPVSTPVTDPLVDFPYSANASEPYRFNVVVNNGEPITEPDQCCGMDTGAIKIYFEQWNDVTVTKTISYAYHENPDILKDAGYVHDYIHASNDQPLMECNDGDGGEYMCGMEFCFQNNNPPSGLYRLVTFIYYGVGGEYYDQAVDITDFHYEP